MRFLGRNLIHNNKSVQRDLNGILWTDLLNWYGFSNNVF